MSLVLRLWGFAPSCSTAELRQLNGITASVVVLVASLSRTLLDLEYRQAKGNNSDDGPSFYSEHTALNIALFPPLFFFSALYYTDVISPLVVLACYQDYQDRRHRLAIGKHSTKLYFRTIIIGVTALLMRQTNIFWVVVFMGGLEVVDAVKTLKPVPVQPHFTTLLQMLKYYDWRYSVGDVHDPPLSYSSPDGMYNPPLHGRG